MHDRHEEDSLARGVTFGYDGHWAGSGRSNTGAFGNERQEKAQGYTKGEAVLPRQIHSVKML
jgi:hypothetical protein